MNRRGFEALADGTMLLIVLLVASTLALSLAAMRPSTGNDAARFAEDTRVALFRTTLDGLSFVQDGVDTPLPDGMSVEAFLRLQVHLVSRDVGEMDFATANNRVTEVARSLMRPGWSFAIVGRVTNASAAVLLPADVAIPESYAASSWSYPALDGSGPDTVLGLSMWLSPRR